MTVKHQMFETTEEHFEIFKQEFLKWVNILGLQRFEIVFRYEAIEDNAMVIADVESMHAIVLFSQLWVEVEPNDYTIKKCVFHEAIELLMVRYKYLATRREFNESELNSESHVIVRTLENAWFDSQYRVDEEESKPVIDEDFRRELMKDAIIGVSHDDKYYTEYNTSNTVEIDNSKNLDIDIKEV